MINKLDEVAKNARVMPATRKRLQAEVAQAYATGSSIRTITRGSNRSYGFIHKLLEEAGVKLRPRGGANRRKKVGA